jgi:uncharacterized protein (DUF4213/DUF364 family)
LVVLLGASTPLTPLLFNYGVSAIAGTHVVEIPATLRAVGQGATLKQIPGQRLMMIQESQSSQQ